MKSIDNLREYALTAASVNATTRAVLAGYIDEIEREVADMVPLPVDADGVPIHVGDVLECDGEEFPPVSALVLTSDGWHLSNVCITRAMGRPGQFTHHHAPTVEDMLREFYVYAERGKEHHREDVDDAVLAEYAAKLRLAGDE